MSSIDRDKITNLVENMVTFFGSNKHKIATFKEQISSVYMNYDRHFTTNNYFKFNIESTFTRFSGARFGIEGTNDELYEIDILRIIDAELQENSITIVEKLSEEITRKSIIDILTV